MIVAGPEGFRKNQYRKFNIRSEDLTPGDDFGMMREVLTRRFKRLMAEAPRAVMRLSAVLGLAEASPHRAACRTATRSAREERAPALAVPPQTFR